MTERPWPVHPQPQPDESLTSWLARVARAHGTPLRSLLSAEFGRYPRHTDLDTLDDPAFWQRIAERTLVAGGIDRIREHGLNDAVAAFGEAAASHWILPVERRRGESRHRWCRKCLSTDTIPYFRRAWRFAWVQWCPVDGHRLIERCPACAASLDFVRVATEEPARSMTTCWRCSSSIAADASLEPPDACPSIVESAVSAAVLSDKADFSVVWCLQHAVRLVRPRYWTAIANDIGFSDALDLGDQPRVDQHEWLTFAIAWHLATGPRERLEAFARKHQTEFDRATWPRCPTSIVSLRRPLLVRHGITPERVDAAIERLLETGIPISGKEIATAVCADPTRVARSHEFRALIEGATNRLTSDWQRRMRDRLRAGVGALGGRGERVTRTALRTEVGVSLETILRFERETATCVAVTPTEIRESQIRTASASLR